MIVDGPAGPTPSQTVGPFFSFGVSWLQPTHLVPPRAPGAVVIAGRVLDGAGEPVPDALLEIWQADADGGFGERPAAEWSGWGRCLADGDGRFRFVTVKPGALNGPEGPQAPHIDVSVFARGLLQRLVTRIYFPDEAARNAADPVLSSLDADGRASLVARQEGDELRFDIRLQGDGETVFFAW